MPLPPRKPSSATFARLGAALSRPLPARRPSPPTGLCVILDLNGVLLERLRARSGKHRAASRAARAKRPPEACRDGREIWLRPYRAWFLSYLAKRYAVAVWSSATQRTVDVVVTTGVVLKGTKIKRKDLEFVKDRSACVPDLKAGNGYGTLKPLRVVYEDEALGGRWGERNTLLVDDSASKCVGDVDNAVNVPEYTALNMRVNYSEDETLLWTAMYLELLLELRRELQSAVETGCASEDLATAKDVKGDIRECVRAAGPFTDFLSAGQRCAMDMSGGSCSVRAFVPVSAVPMHVCRTGDSAKEHCVEGGGVEAATDAEMADMRVDDAEDLGGGQSFDSLPRLKLSVPGASRVPRRTPES